MGAARRNPLRLTIGMGSMSKPYHNMLWSVNANMPENHNMQLIDQSVIFFRSKGLQID
jgi:hypothetical protein